QYRAAMTGDVRGLKIGLPKEYFDGLESETGNLVQRSIDDLKKLGCEIREISLPATKYAVPCYYVISSAEASSNLARFDGVRYTALSANSDTLSDMYRNTRGEYF